MADTKIPEIESLVNGNSKIKGSKCGRRFKPRPVSDWVLLIMSCVCNALLMGYVYGLSALFMEIKYSFMSSRAKTAMVQSMTIGIMCCGGFIAPLPASIFGIGNMCIIGASFGCIAIISAFMLTDLTLIILVSGVIGGIGLCNMFAIPYIAIGKVFKDSYNSALAALLLAGGMGYFAFPYLNVLMFQNYGWRAVFLLHGGLLLNYVPLGMFFRIKLSKDKSSSNSIKQCCSNSFFKSHISLWKDPVHVTFFVSLILRSVPLGLVNYFMLDIAAYKGFDEVTGSLFLSSVGLGNLIGRAVVLATRPIIKFDSVREYSCHVFLTGLTISLIGIVNSYELLITCCFLFGLPYGMLSSTANIAVFSIAGEDRYPTALGIYNTGMGIGFGIAGPVGGVIKDNVESYDLILYGFAAVSTLSGLCTFLVAVFYKRKPSMNNDMSIEIEHT